MSAFGGNNSAALTIAQVAAESTNPAELAAALAALPQGITLAQVQAALAGVSGIVTGQVIGHIGATPPGFADVDAPALVPTSQPEWRLRSSPGGGTANFVSATFCAAGNTLFGIYWDGFGTSSTNIHAAIIRSTDYETVVVKSVVPFSWYGSALYALSASAIDADRVLVCASVQGYNNIYAYIYTISTDSWLQVTNFYSGNYAQSLSMVTLNDGRVMCQAFGLGAKLFNPATLTWTACAANANNCGYLLKMADGRVLTTGYSSNGSTTNVIIYNPADDTWTWTTAVPGALGVTGGFRFSNGKLAVSCGNRSNQFYIFDPVTATWTTDSLGFNKGSGTNSLVAFATTANGQVFALWGYYKGQQVIGSGGSTSDMIWAGWHQLEFKHPDIQYLSSNLRSIVKVA